ncbi:twin-arginine translocase subunit TatB [Actinobacillus succinogenes]|uniref:Sec-independent protein translocase protein TatB n=1 Tax=Actinobacillus succinogenes (strain ATCC 55618 / DSM 22257 / CCUG 43843 / 130Z) TaxID=339671 RepID=A6VM41_ACTSZ|nr:Sec-independent protein translocase protein TatB [Actinobacillus succinogenes]ABR74038.1 twin-arginine translocation protein, TatB subunit [Actinobacillus succinogenes 130Z]PHI39526.1 twin-arginine translocase subunit TatB [Actinobacillus succinogenes]
MFDIGFSELLLIFIVGLVVLGPQRMPVAVRTVMKWVRTVRGLAANVQNELSQELKLQELQESIKKAENLNLKTLSPDLAKTVDELKASAEKMKADLDKQASDANKTLEEQIKDVREANFRQSQSQADEVAETLEKTPQNATALESENLQTATTEVAENTAATMSNEASLDEQLAKYIDQYHPAEDVQPVSSSEKNV